MAITPCKKDKEDPVYAGTRVSIQSMDIFKTSEPVNVRVTLILTESNFEWNIDVELGGIILNTVL